jgi:citrate lyase subunit gamma (acyl carrier protein)
MNIVSFLFDLRKETYLFFLFQPAIETKFKQMQIINNAQAGTLESSDVMVVIYPADKGSGRNIQLNSNVSLQYGDSIKADVNEVLDVFDVKDIKMLVTDKGALSPVIKARVEAAVKRAMGKQEGTLK